MLQEVLYPEIVLNKIFPVVKGACWLKGLSSKIGLAESGIIQLKGETQRFSADLDYPLSCGGPLSVGTTL